VTSAFPLQPQAGLQQSQKALTFSPVTSAVNERSKAIAIAYMFYIFGFYILSIENHKAICKFGFYTISYIILLGYKNIIRNNIECRLVKVKDYDLIGVQK
jgi:hypothetical protein